MSPSLSTSAMDAVREIVNARMEPMERACELVLQLGYLPAECLIEHHRPDVHSLGGWTERDVLVVRGVPAFEVTTVLKDMLFTTSSRVLTWPQPRAPEPAPTSVGGLEA